MTDVNAQVASAVAVKLPQFWKEDPKTWFCYVESTFSLRNITVSRTKYEHVLHSLPYEVVCDVKDIIAAPGNEPYELLKKTLVSRTSISERDRLRQLLSNEDLGDRKPTQLLRHMQTLLGPKQAEFDQELLRELFTQRLPTDVQQVLAATPPDTNITALAEIADRVLEVNKSSVCAVKSERSNPQEDLINMVSDLTKQIAELSADVQKLKSQRGRSTSRKRSDSSRKRTNGLCYYHRKYGSKAYKCQSPCSFQGNGQSEC